MGVAAGQGDQHLRLLHGGVGTLSVHHAEGDALGLRGEDPGDAGPGVSHGDAYQAVAARLDEELSGAVPETGDVFDAEGDGQGYFSRFEEVDLRVLNGGGHMVLRVIGGHVTGADVDGPRGSSVLVTLQGASGGLGDSVAVVDAVHLLLRDDVKGPLL